MSTHKLIPKRTSYCASCPYSLTHHLLAGEGWQKKVKGQDLLENRSRDPRGGTWQPQLPGGGELVQLWVGYSWPLCLVGVAQQGLSHHCLSQLLPLLSDALPAARTLNEVCCCIWPHFYDP